MTWGAAIGGHSEPFRLLLIANDPEVASMAIAAGIDFVMVDLEIAGKLERQRNRDTLISRHSMDDVSRLRGVCPAGSLVVRINPWLDGGSLEVIEALDRGADQIMLPMFRSLDELRALSDSVEGRAGIIPLVETPEALSIVVDAATVPGVTRIHFGLNDLHLAMGSRFMFEVLIDGRLSAATAALKSRGLRFGIGGVARVGEGLVPAELVIGEHIHLGSSAAILSRTFHRRGEAFSAANAADTLRGEVERLREVIGRFSSEAGAVLMENRRALVAAVDSVVRSL